MDLQIQLQIDIWAQEKIAFVLGMVFLLELRLHTQPQELEIPDRSPTKTQAELRVSERELLDLVLE
jgi:hypothetical protein